MNKKKSAKKSAKKKFPKFPKTWNRFVIHFNLREKGLLREASLDDTSCVLELVGGIEAHSPG